MVYLLETPRVIVFFFFYYYMIDLVRLFQKRSFVLSSEHENNNVATLADVNLFGEDSICMVNLLETL